MFRSSEAKELEEELITKMNQLAKFAIRSDEGLTLEMNQLAKFPICSDEGLTVETSAL